MVDPVESATPRYVLRYTLTFDDMLGAGRFYQQKTLERTLLVCAAGIVVGVVLLTVYPAIGGGLIGGFAILLVLTYFQVTARLFGPRKVRNLIGTVVQVALSDDGIDSSGPLSSSHIPWTSITKVRANGRFVLLLGESLLLSWLPASAFSTPAEMADVVRYARNHAAATTGAARAGPRI